MVIPRKYQRLMIDELTEYYTQNDIATLAWDIGLGKIITALLLIKEQSYKTIIINGDISILCEIIDKVLLLFPDANIIKTNREDKIEEFLLGSNNYPKFIITKLRYNMNIKVDIKICIEQSFNIHYKRYSDAFFHIQSDKTLILTSRCNDPDYVLFGRVFGLENNIEIPKT